jgi:hypothetical protein
MCLVLNRMMLRQCGIFVEIVRRALNCIKIGFLTASTIIASAKPKTTAGLQMISALRLGCWLLGNGAVPE